MSKTWWLLAGIVLVAVSQLRWGIGLLAFVAPVPFLAYLRGTRGVRSRLWFSAAVLAAYTLATLKIVTEPLVPIFAFLYSVPFTLAYAPAFLAADAVRRRSPPWVGVLAFPSLMVLVEYALHRLTPFGSWAAAAYTQVDNLPLLQVASLTGMAGVSFIVYFVGAALEALIADPRAGRAPATAAAVVLVVAVSYGSLRLTAAATGETVTVAAVGTDGTIRGWPVPPEDELERVDEGLFARTAQAASAGAKLVSWTEASNAVPPHKEAAYLERLRAAAREHQIELVASYIVPHDDAQQYENKYVWVRPTGEIDHVYNKHYPVPGEPAIAGTEPFRAVDTAAGRATGAICYDFDFPALGLAQARLGIDLAVLPSSDWRGIDPIHTQMASVRAIEGGYSLLRSTRFGLSAGYDPYGRVRAWESSFDTQKRVLLVGLPRRGVNTVYTRIGDAFVGLCAAFIAATAAWAALGARRTEGES